MGSLKPFPHPLFGSRVKRGKVRHVHTVNVIGVEAQGAAFIM
jgi:hypothetical protein